MTRKFVPDSSGKPTIEKVKGASLDYGVDFTSNLTAINDTIASATVEVSDGLSKSNLSNTSYIVKFNLSGGVVDTTEWASVTVTTNSTPPRLIVQTVYFKIVPR